MMRARRIALAPMALLACVACHHEEEVGTISGPPLLVDRDASAASSAPDASALDATDAAAPDASAPIPPLRADFADVEAKDGFHVEQTTECTQGIFVAVKGKIVVTGTNVNETLAAGDVLTVQGKGAFDVRGPGTVVRANVVASSCEPVTKSKLVRAASVKPLAWAGGKMHATLLVEKDDAKFAYVGMLNGSASVAEHVHEQSWEILCAIDAAGELTLAGVPSRLGPRTCVTVPPNTKHAWTPDAGRTLSAVQFYVPAGPEQRFRGLAAAERDR